MVTDQRRDRNAERANTVTLLWQSERVLGARIVSGVIAAGHDIRPRYSAVFGQLGTSSLRISELARVAGMTPQGMSLLVDEMEHRGFVERRADPHDRRAKLIALTAAGREATATAAHAIGAIESSLDDLLGTSKHHDLRGMLKKIVAADAGSDSVLP